MRTFIRVIGALAVLNSGVCHAQNAPAAREPYPVRPVRIVVPFAAGGPADVYARVLAQRLQESLGQPFVIDNRPGGGSVLGTDIVAKSAPDGYTLLLMSNTHTVNESLMPQKPFVLMRDFVGIAPINYSDLVLVVHPTVKANTIAELVAEAKAAPGKMNYASSGPGTPYHMAGELFKAMAGIDVVHVPYKGSGEARAGVLGGQVQMMFDAVTVMSQHAREGKVKALGTSGTARSSVLPGVPTIAEAGVPGFETVAWFGVFAPAATPRDVVERLNAEINRIVATAEFRDVLQKLGTVPANGTPEAFAQRIAADVAKWKRVVEAGRIKAD